MGFAWVNATCLFWFHTESYLWEDSQVYCQVSEQPQKLFITNSLILDLQQEVLKTFSLNYFTVFLGDEGQEEGELW